MDVALSVEATQVASAYQLSEADFGVFIDDRSLAVVFDPTEVDTLTGVLTETLSATFILSAPLVDISVALDGLTATSVLAPIETDATVGTIDVAVSASITTAGADAGIGQEENQSTVGNVVAEQDIAVFDNKESFAKALVPSVEDTLAGIAVETPSVSLQIISTEIDQASPVDASSQTVVVVLISVDAATVVEQQTQTFALAVAVVDGLARTDDISATAIFAATDEDHAVWLDTNESLASAIFSIVDAQTGIESPTSSAGNAVVSTDVAAFVEQQVQTFVLATTVVDELVQPSLQEAPSTSIVLPLSIEERALFADGLAISGQATGSVTDAGVLPDADSLAFAFAFAVSDEYIPFSGGISGIEVIVSKRQRTFKISSRPTTSQVSARLRKSSPPGKGDL